MTKHQRYILSTLMLTIMLMGVYWIDLDYRYYLIGIMSLAAGALTWWSMKEAARGLTRWMIMILPIMFTIGAGMTTFLLPDTIPSIWMLNLDPNLGWWLAWLIRSIFWIAYFLSIYFMFSTQNIIAVSAIRTIPLVRAARSVGFTLTLVAGYLLYNAVWSFRLPYYYNFLLVLLVTFPLLLQGLWVVRLEDRLSKHVLFASLILAMLISQIALILSFWPLIVSIASICLATALYVLLGLYQYYLMRRLFRQEIVSYNTIGLVVFITMIFFTSWRG